MGREIKLMRWVGEKVRVVAKFGSSAEGNRGCSHRGLAYLPAVAYVLWSRLCQSLSRQGAGSQRDLQGSHCHSGTAVAPHQHELWMLDSPGTQWLPLAHRRLAHVAAGHYWRKALGEALHLGRGWVLPRPAHPEAQHLEVHIG